MDIKIPKISKEFMAQVDKTQAEMKLREELAQKSARNAARRKWLLDNIVGIIAALVAVLSIIVSVLMGFQQSADPLRSTSSPQVISVE